MNKIYFFDLDGTITNEEILPKIAERFNFKKKMKMLTRSAMAGDVPFESSFKLRHKMLSRFELKKIRQVVEKISLNKFIVNFINDNSDNCKIVTGNLDKWIEPLKKKIRCEFFTSISEDNGKQLKYIMNKGEVIKKIKCKKKIFIGDGYNDIGAFRHSNINIAYGKVHCPPESLINMSDYFISDEKKLCLLLEQL